ncbi:hypothetical protein FXV77_05390 [Sphingobacterium phlebotomi]|uniref:Uncharacterized protein n=1 Tax=Sphingobacterium phlebotomi TaxID=2605433 RepID=A0A5D4HC93_9SPHI|nr:hypothetical protein [Sphingobacterium phlebotomi]TYR37439.1 hypothetical protein FXV77_05390 [Sphingobacterium phlebotomi]
MAILKNNWLRTSSLIALMLAFFVTANASENNEEKKAEKDKPEKTILATTWHFIGTSLSEVFEEDKWQSADPGESSCSSAARPLPCAYTVTDEDIADTDELVTYLRATHQNNPSAVAPAADSRKLEE